MVWHHPSRQFVVYETEAQSSERIFLSLASSSCMSHIVVRFHSPALPVRQNTRNDLQTCVELWLSVLLSISPSLAHGLRSKRWLCKTIIMYFHIDELWLPALQATLLLMGSCQEWDALHIRILNRKGGGEMPSLLPFDINQLKASLHLLLHLFFSFALWTVLCISPLLSC